MATLRNLVQQVADETGGYLAGTTTSAGEVDGTTVVDTTNLQDSTLQDQHYWARSWVLITSGLNNGEVRRVTGFTAATGTLTVEPAFSNQVASGVTYEVYRSLPPERYREVKGYKDFVNDALARTYHHERALLTLISDGDMESSGTTSWTASSATLSKATAEANVYHGAQSLRVQNSAAGGYAASASFPVVPTRQYIVAAFVKVSAGTARLQVYDDTHGTVRDEKTTQERTWRVLAFSWQAASGQRSASIRLVGDEATADIYWDDVYVQDLSARMLDLPAWITEEDQFHGVVELPWGSSTSAGADYAVDELPFRARVGDTLAINPRAARDTRVWLASPIPTAAFLYAEASRPFAELATYTDTTTADADQIVARACLFYWQYFLHIPGIDREHAQKEAIRWAEKVRALDGRFAVRHQVRKKSPW